VVMGVKPATGPVWLGIDVGSVTTKAVAVGETGAILAHICHETMGQPARQVVRGLVELGAQLAEVRRKPRVRGVGTTGSGRSLAAALVGGDVVKNEITAHAVAALDLVPDVRTVLEIGGQDSKIILLRDGGVSDFAMNTVCAVRRRGSASPRRNWANLPCGRSALSASPEGAPCSPKRTWSTSSR